MRDWKKYLREHLSLDGVSGEAEGEILEELAAHLSDVAEAALARGATEEEVEVLVRAEVENWEALAVDVRRTRRGAAVSRTGEGLEAAELAFRRRGGFWAGLADAMREVRFAARRLRKVPGFTVVVVLTLGVGIGAITAMFGVVKGVLLDPLPYPDPGELVAVYNSAPGLGQEQLDQCMAFNAVYEDESRSFQDVGVWYPHNLTAVLDGTPEEVRAISATDGLFRALGVSPLMGRGFTAEDTDPGSPVTALLSYGFWRTRLGGDPSVLGTVLDINGVPVEVVGVMPRGFRIMDRDPALYLPFQYNRSRLTVTQFTFQSIGRLRPGVTVEAAETELMRLVPLAVERYPGGMTMKLLEEARGAPLLRPLRDDLLGGVAGNLWMVLGGVAIILLVACANVANLLLVRADTRERAVAVQSALGSSRGRVVGQFMVESIMLGLSGGALGVALARVGLLWLQRIGPEGLPRLHEISLDPGVLLFALVLSLAAGTLLGPLSVLRLGRMDLTRALKTGGWGGTSRRDRGRARDALVVAQLALSLVLLVGSGLMVRSVRAMAAVNPGFTRADEVLTFQLGIPRSAVPNGEELPAAHEALARRLEDLPGVTAVGLSTSVPLDHAYGFDPVYAEDFPVPEGQQPPIRRFKWVGGGYVEAIGNRVVAGRTINWDDIRNHARVVMITEGMARELWGAPARAVGRRVATGFGPGDWREVIGVVGDVRDDGVSQGPVDIVYWPMVMDGFWRETRGDALFVQRYMKYVVRSPRVGTSGFTDEVSDAVHAMYPSAPLRLIRTMSDYYRRSTARTSFILVMLSIAAVVALLLGVIGIYGVVAYAVERRTRELGLRIAMGAEPLAVTVMVLRQGLVLAGIGAVIGLAAAFGLSRFMEAALFGVSPADPLTYVLTAVGLMAVALAATYMPARRAARVDPAVALRAE